MSPFLPCTRREKAAPGTGRAWGTGGLGWAPWATGTWKSDCGNRRRQQQQEGSSHARSPQHSCLSDGKAAQQGLGRQGGSGSTRGPALELQRRRKRRRESLEAEEGTAVLTALPAIRESPAGAGGSLAGPLRVPLSLLCPGCQPCPGTCSSHTLGPVQGGHGHPRGQHEALGCPHGLCHTLPCGCHPLRLHQSLSRGPGAVPGWSPALHTSPSSLSLHGGQSCATPSKQRYLRKYFIVEGQCRGSVQCRQQRRCHQQTHTHTMVAPEPGGSGSRGCSPYAALGRPLRRMMAR